ncbi:MAG: hypothetical protein LUG16_02865 [Candidatus Gastranaerophilales bacterium]|nr:hypothetical protein [Candidatus Gastranaerophilales bacterium]
MKNFSCNFFNITALFLFFIIIIVVVLPFNLINLEQAQRIAKWKSEFEKLDYSFSLVSLYEGIIVPSNFEAGKIVDSEYMFSVINKYFDMNDRLPEKIKKYSYRKMNGTKISKKDRFYFNKFIFAKDGTMISVKENPDEITSSLQPLYFMFIDINGVEKPNRIGQDIFFMDIYKNSVSTEGEALPYSRLKADCSPIGSGVYCSEFYLLGGKF